MKLKMRLAVLSLALLTAMSSMAAVHSVNSKLGGTGSPSFGNPAGVIFDDGATDGLDNGFFIDGPNPGPFSQSISDGFFATGSGSASALDFGVWVPTGTTLTTVTWWLGSTGNFSQDLGTGTVTSANFSSTLVISNNPFGYDVYTIHLTNMSSGNMNAGSQYWLSLGNANDSGGTQFDAWDLPSANGGPATCEFAVGGVDQGGCGLGGESFTLFSGNVGTPEPGSLVLLGSGVLGLAGVLRRKINF
jgi:hypothetical protein